MQKFFVGTFQDYKAQVKLSSKFADEESRRDFVNRLLRILNEIDDEIKIDYLANLARSVLLNLIDLPLFYKLSKILRFTTREELNYLSENINRGESVIDVYVASLLQHGLAMKYDLGRGYMMSGPYEDTYDFTHLGLCLDMFAISFNVDGKYKYSGIVKLNELSTRGLRQDENEKRHLENGAIINEDTVESLSEDDIKKALNKLPVI